MCGVHYLEVNNCGVHYLEVSNCGVHYLKASCVVPQWALFRG